MGCVGEEGVEYEVEQAGEYKVNAGRCRARGEVWDLEDTVESETSTGIIKLRKYLVIPPDASVRHNNAQHVISPLPIGHLHNVLALLL